MTGPAEVQTWRGVADWLGLAHGPQESFTGSTQLGVGAEGEQAGLLGYKIKHRDLEVRFFVCLFLFLKA